ncbi:Cytochrome P450 85A [Ranunculus cassubicifolius]
MAVLLVVFVLFLCLLLSTALLRWNEMKYRKKGLPPGTMGWPVFGETTEFLKQGPSFMKNQRARFGHFFKSHLLGSPIVVSMDPEVNRHILLSEGKGLVPGYPQSMLDILGKCNIAAVHGATHKSMRGALLGIINPSNIKENLLPKIDDFMRSHLNNWDGKTVDIQQKTKEMALSSMLKQIGIESCSEALKTEFCNLVQGTISLPINLPGTNYHSGLEARKNIIRILKNILDERRASSCVEDDMLGCLMRWEDSGQTLSDEVIMDQIITLLYSGYETVSTTSMMVVKYLHDHPKALQEIREEHMEIRKRKQPGDAIDWNEYKSMKFTRAVILESMRLATIVNGVLRKTTHDMEINGYLIPKGWRIYVYTREANYDPYLYPDPLTFNPWRWQDKSIEHHKHFMLFGGGTRLCPGKESGIAEISTFIHYFVTKYSWEEMEGQTLEKFPRVQAPNGLHINVSSN